MKKFSIEIPDALSRLFSWLLALLGMYPRGTVEFLVKHYEDHLYSAPKFKETMEGLYSVTDEAVEHGEIRRAEYYCSREQLMRANGARHVNWGPIPKRLAGATFVVGADHRLRMRPDLR